MANPSPQVLIVGAGPVGLTTGIVLTQYGHSVTLVDALPEPAQTSRAAVVHSRTLEVLEPYGVTELLTARGIKLPQFTIRDRDRVLVTVPFQDLPTEYPYTLMISQADTEALLYQRLRELGGSVRRATVVSAIAQDSDRAVATMSDGTQISADYIVAADGMHSTVREAAKIAFRGDTYPESLVLADVRLRGGMPASEGVMYFSPAGMVVAAPLPDGTHRIVAAVDDAPKEPSAELVQQLLDTRGPQAARAVVDEVVWSSRFRVHHRIAESFRQGRILLAGDAAHVHSPAGGQGMNLGIEDAVLLGRALSKVLEGGPESLLDEYSKNRKPAAQAVIALTGRLTSLATAGPRVRPLRNLALTVVGKLPAFNRKLAWQLSGLSRR